MAKAQYSYNPSTDSYERIYPTWKTRLRGVARTMLMGAIVWGVTLLVLWMFFGFKNETYIVKDNATLKTQYKVLEKRLSSALQILDKIKERDDNFYRVIMQMEPVKSAQRYAGLSQVPSFEQLQKLDDKELLEKLTQNIDILERLIYSQSVSFDELRTEAFRQKDKFDHVPAVLPINIKDYTMSSGYGHRVDPVYGGSAFHAGLDFAAPSGTPVYATADGVVQVAERAGGYGNKVDISHGYNYLTRYAHLSKIDVKTGQAVHRGEKIGEVGSTGKSTGPHLHYEVRYKDEPQNPVNYYFLDVTPEQYAAMVDAAENAGHVMD